MQDEVAELARRRGFLWQAFEVYGGAAGFYDYGPLGALLKRRVEAAWREFYLREGFYEVETPTVAPRAVFEASGHLESFSDQAVVCRQCRNFFRVAEREEVRVGQRCPECGGELEDAGEFNLMFQTRIGVPRGGGGRGAGGDEKVERRKSEGYLRPETAQGIFLNFPRLLRFNRGKLPFGAFQIGKAYRNEISPRKSLIRLREFTMAEAEVFVDPAEKEKHPRFAAVKEKRLRLVPSAEGEGKGEGKGEEKGEEKREGKGGEEGEGGRGGEEKGEEKSVSVEEAVKSGVVANEFLGYHIARVEEFLVEGLGIPRERLKFRQHRRDEMAHYATDCWDAEFFSERYGWMEIVGVADRGDYDLSAHSLSGGGAGTPNVIEPSYGIDRIVYALLESSFYEEQVGKEKRKVLRFKKEVAPVRAAVLPLLKREELKKKARAVFQELRAAAGMFVEYDESGSIGRRYRRQDEIGTPFCVTVDYETLEDDTVTVRERDTMKQVRVVVGEVKNVVKLFRDF